MQNIKKLKSKSIEGLEVKNFMTFPSMEWGEDGGLQADLYLNGKYVAQVYQEGNGGCASVFYQTGDENVIKNVNKACFDFLIRNDKNFGPNSEYEFMRDKTAETIDTDDIECVVNLLKERHDHIKEAERALKKNRGKIAVVDMGYQIKYFMCGAAMTDDIFKEKTNITYPFKLYTLTELQQAF